MVVLENDINEQFIRDKQADDKSKRVAHARDNLCGIEMKKPIALSNEYQLLKTDDDSDDGSDSDNDHDDHNDNDHDDYTDSDQYQTWIQVGGTRKHRLHKRQRQRRNEMKAVPEDDEVVRDAVVKEFRHEADWHALPHSQPTVHRHGSKFIINIGRCCNNYCHHNYNHNHNQHDKFSNHVVQAGPNSARNNCQIDLPKWRFVLVHRPHSPVSRPHGWPSDGG